MTRNTTEPFLESTVSSSTEDVSLYRHILALKKRCFALCFPQFSYNQQRAQFPEWDLNPVQAGLCSQRGGEDRAGAAATTFNHDTVLQ